MWCVPARCLIFKKKESSVFTQQERNEHNVFVYTDDTGRNNQWFDGTHVRRSLKIREKRERGEKESEKVVLLKSTGRRRTNYNFQVENAAQERTILLSAFNGLLSLNQVTEYMPASSLFIVQLKLAVVPPAVTTVRYLGRSSET